jgi:hypothetical protein
MRANLEAGVEGPMFRCTQRRGDSGRRIGGDAAARKSCRISEYLFAVIDAGNKFAASPALALSSSTVNA